MDHKKAIVVVAVSTAVGAVGILAGQAAATSAGASERTAYYVGMLVGIIAEVLAVAVVL